MVPPIDVVLIGVTGMLSQIVKGILDEPDIRVRGDLPHDGSIVSQLRAKNADVVILADEHRALTTEVHELLSERPRTKVLTILDHGRETFLYELRPFQIRLGQVSPQTLLDAVRTARTAPL
jgi:DNA-binding NarL/FixJ family response regulator